MFSKWVSIGAFLRVRFCACVSIAKFCVSLKWVSIGIHLRNVR